MDKIDAAIANLLFYTVHWRAFSSPCLLFCLLARKIGYADKIAAPVCQAKEASLKCATMTVTLCVFRHLGKVGNIQTCVSKLRTQHVKMYPNKM